MDRFISKAVDSAVDKMFGDDDDERRPAQGLQQGGGNLTHGGAYPAGGGFSHADDSDLRTSAASAAAKNAPEDEDFFSGVLGKLLEKKSLSQVADEDLDEEDAVQSHRKFFGLGGSSTPPRVSEPASTSSLGSAAAMQALKLFTSGEAKTESQNQSAFVGLAMAQAAKLFEKQASEGNVAAGADKQSVVMKAGEMALKMYLKSQGSKSSGGADQSGLGGLLSMAGRFMK
ncbi:hypothetical protein VTI74DRAFT_3341 [Chaetomium olivicolor]